MAKKKKSLELPADYQLISKATITVDGGYTVKYDRRKEGENFNDWYGSNFHSEDYVGDFSLWQ